MNQKIHIHTIPDFHKVAGLSQSVYSLLSVARLEDLRWKPVEEKTTIIRDFISSLAKKISILNLNMVNKI